MSFTSYLVNMGIDAVLGIVGIIGLLAAFGSFINGNNIVGAVFLVVGALPLLYTRYRAKKQDITY
jgi:hypothetical protein